MKLILFETEDWYLSIYGSDKELIGLLLNKKPTMLGSSMYMLNQNSQCLKMIYANHRYVIRVIIASTAAKEVTQLLIADKDPRVIKALRSRRLPSDYITYD